MWNRPSKEELALVPGFYATEHVPLKEKVLHLHFFSGGSDWWAAEYDPRSQTFFGFAILNGDYEMSEWGYFNLEEMDQIRIGFLGIDRNLWFSPTKAIEVDLIRKAQGWEKEEGYECKPCA